MAEKRKNVNHEMPATLLGGTAIKPKELTTGQAIRYFFYNPDTGAYFTRTPKSWALIIIFYCIYYTLLACFWYGMLLLFLSFLTEDRPKFILDESIIGTNPGVGMQPSQPDISIDSSMLKLKFDAKDENPSNDFESASNIDWAKRYERVLKLFANATGTRSCSDSEPGDGTKDPCVFDPAVLGECNNFPYGFQLSGSQEQITPCVLLKINRIFGWAPEEYSEDDLTKDDPDDPMPDSVKRLVRSDPRKVYLDCQGENPADREGLAGGVRYFPSDQGISFKYFPYEQAKGNYHNPLVAVQFTDLPLGQLFHVECKLWAKGVKHFRKDRIGQVHFEIMLE